MCVRDREKTGEVIREVSTEMGVSKAVVLLHTLRSHINPVEPVTAHTLVTHTPLPDTVYKWL